MSKKRTQYSTEFKAKIALVATLNNGVRSIMKKMYVHKKVSGPESRILALAKNNSNCRWV